MITDRTAEIVEAARVARKKLLDGAAYSSLTEAEKTALGKGACSIDTLNRIEAAADTLADALEAAGYKRPSVDVVNGWLYDDYFSESDLLRLFDNARLIRAAYVVLPTTPSIPSAAYHWQAFNALEQNLQDVSLLLDNMDAIKPYSGEFFGGEL